MAIESAMIPLPSEIIMPFAGFLASTGRFNIHLVALAGAFGNLIGSLIGYGIGYWGRDRVVRRFVKKWGKFLLISETELDEATRLLHKHRYWVVLGSRVIPGIRTIISLPCGVARLPLLSFCLLTFFGSLVWSYLLAWIGFILGQNWDTLGPIFHKADTLIIVGVVIIIGFYVYTKLKKKRPA
jgi:membrane protein DedA with SNARE-associated domain